MRYRRTFMYPVRPFIAMFIVRYQDLVSWAFLLLIHTLRYYRVPVELSRFLFAIEYCLPRSNLS